MVDAGNFLFEQLGEHTLKVDKNTGEVWVLSSTGFDFFWAGAREMDAEERQAERRRLPTRTQKRE